MFGAGIVGLPVAPTWKTAGIKVTGVDIDEKAVRAIDARTMPINEDRLRELMVDTVVAESLPVVESYEGWCDRAVR